MTDLEAFYSWLKLYRKELEAQGLREYAAAATSILRDFESRCVVIKPELLKLNKIQVESEDV